MQLKDRSLMYHVTCTKMINKCNIKIWKIRCLVIFNKKQTM